MDRETLSNYGWVVCVILVLAIMISLATPFGSVIRDKVAGTVENFKGNAEGVLDNMGGVTSFDDLGGGGSGGGISGGGGSAPDSYDHNAPELHPTGVELIDDYMYEYGDYVYYDYGDYWNVDVNNSVVDRSTQVSYGPILESINGKPIGMLDITFGGCSAMVTAPVIPQGVKYMCSTFQYCASLVNAPTLPAGITDLNGFFTGCESLKVAPAIPNSVTSMSCAFEGCKSLEVAPAIPGGVTDMSQAFSGCTSLKTAPAIPDGVTYLGYAFADCTALTGTITVSCAFRESADDIAPGSSATIAFTPCVDEDTSYRCDICDGILAHTCVSNDGDIACDVCDSTVEHNCVDYADGYGYCGACGSEIVHTCAECDKDSDHRCDVCNNILAHTCAECDPDGDNCCNVCDGHVACIDDDADGYCDYAGCEM